MNIRYFSKVCFIALLLPFCAQQLFAQVPSDVPWATPNGKIVQDGIMAISCSTNGDLAAGDQYTFGLVNTGALTYNTAEASPVMYHHPDWIISKIGTVWGTTFDKNRNIYLAATAHAPGKWGGFPNPGWRYGDIGGGAESLAAAGTIYKIDAATGVPTVFAQLPQQSTTIRTFIPLVPGQSAGQTVTTRTTGPGLFGLDYDKDHDQFYVSNMEDGKIYIVKADGTYVSANAFDPLTADNGAAGIVALGERVMTVRYYNNRVYYSLRGDGTNQLTHIIRSVAVNSSGLFDAASDHLELSVSSPTGYTGSAPVLATVTDIEFSRSGLMAVGLASLSTEYLPVFLQGTHDYTLTHYNHSAYVDVFQYNGTSWAKVKRYNPSIANAQRESYGGVDWADYGALQDEVLWSSSADMITSTTNPTDEHGVIGYKYSDLPNFASDPTGPTTNNRMWFQYDAALGDVKGFGQEVEVFYNDEVLVCRTVTNPSAAQTLCSGTTGTNITVNTDYNAANGIKFVKFTADQMAGATPTATEATAIYAGTVIATVTPTGAGSPYTATYTFNAADFPNTTSAPITYYVYAILNPDLAATCRPVQEIAITVNPKPSPTLTQTAPTCASGTAQNNGKITLTVATNADKYGVSTGATYSGTPNYAAATAIGTLPIDVQTAIPNTGGTYTIRLFNGTDTCYTDQTVMVQPVSCCPDPNCGTMTVTKN